MLFEALEVLKWAPKVTLVYVGTALINGLAISNIFLGVTIFLDLLDYLI